MKNLKLIIFAAATSALFVACSGDHGTSGGKDTAGTAEIGPYDVKTNIDTSKTVNTMGDATILDNTSSGGTMLTKDTTHMKVRSVTIAAAAPTAAPVPADTAKTAPKK